MNEVQQRRWRTRYESLVAKVWEEAQYYSAIRLPVREEFDAGRHTINLEIMLSRRKRDKPVIWYKCWRNVLEGDRPKERVPVDPDDESLGMYESLPAAQDYLRTTNIEKAVSAAIEMEGKCLPA